MTLESTQTKDNTMTLEKAYAQIKQAQHEYDQGLNPDLEFFKNGRVYLNTIKKDVIMKDFEKLGADALTLKYLSITVDFDVEYAKDKRSFMSEWSKRIDFWNKST